MHHAAVHPCAPTRVLVPPPPRAPSLQDFLGKLKGELGADSMKE